MNGKLFIVSFPTPTTTTLPPLLTVNAAVHTLDSTPVHSITQGGAGYSPPTAPSPSPPRAPNSLRMSRALPRAPRDVLTRYVAHDGTRLFAKSRRFCSMSVITIGCAPEARDARRALRPIGPAPQITTPRPRVRFAMRRAARTTLRGSSRAPWVKSRLSGNLLQHFSPAPLGKE